MKKKAFAVLMAALTVVTATVNAMAAEADTEKDTRERTTVYVEDIRYDDWYAPAARFVISYDLMNCEETTKDSILFQPEEAISRQEVAEAIYRTTKLINEKMVEDKYYVNVKGRKDYYDTDPAFQDAVMYCAVTGVMTGNADGLLKPLDPITREEFATLLARYVGVLERASAIDGVVNEEGMVIKDFTDSYAISDWARNNVLFCLKNKLMTGDENGAFNPKGIVTRAQMAQVLYNLAPEKAKEQ